MVVLSKLEIYRAKAAQCEEMARLVSDLKAKQELLTIARGWLSMAARIAQDEQREDRPRRQSAS